MFSIRSASQIKWQISDILQALAINHHVKKFDNILSSIHSILMNCINQFVKRKMINAVNVASAKCKRCKS